MTQRHTYTDVMVISSATAELKNKMSDEISKTKHRIGSGNYRAKLTEVQPDNKPWNSSNLE